MAGIFIALCVFALFSVHSVNSQVYAADTARIKAEIDSCTVECVKKVQESNVIGSTESCGRGCRFLNIVHLISNTRDGDPNATRNSCKTMCQQSYKAESSELISCITGCSLPTVPSEAVPILTEFSWSLFIENGNSFQILQGEVPEADDVLTDPGLRSQVTKKELHRLPEVSLRTLPVQPENGNEPNLGPCSSLHNPALPYSYCLIWSLLLLLLLFVLWSCLSLADLPLQQSAPTPPLLEEKLPLA